jgi:hypothetical protein
MEEDGRRTLTGFHGVHTVSAARIDMAATHGQGVQHSVLGLQDLVRVGTDARLATP